MAFIAAGAPPRDIKSPPPWTRTIADSGTRREAQVPARRGMDNQVEGHDYWSGDFITVLDREANTHPTPGRRRVRTSHINYGSARDGGGGPAILNSRFRAAYGRSINSNIQLIQKIDIELLLLLLRSSQTAWDRFGRTGMFEVGGVVVLLGTSLLRHPCRKPGNGGNVMCQFESAGEALAGHHRTELASANRWCGQLSILVFRPRPGCEMAEDLRLGRLSSDLAREPERTGSAGV